MRRIPLLLVAIAGVLLLIGRIGRRGGRTNGREPAGQQLAADHLRHRPAGAHPDGLERLVERCRRRSATPTGGSAVTPPGAAAAPSARRRIRTTSPRPATSAGRSGSRSRPRTPTARTRRCPLRPARSPASATLRRTRSSRTRPGRRRTAGRSRSTTATGRVRSRSPSRISGRAAPRSSSVCTNLAGATGSSVLLDANQVGLLMRATVIASNVGGQDLGLLEH